MSRVGENIRKVREASGMTEKTLAKNLGVAERFIIDVEGGRRVMNESMIQRCSK
ncbi:MAG: helix-turn-helix transcriptional regulator, partial [Clostridium sp.]|nr:helix-turn-helix transcriptional regulator [Clostridium sp.]